MHSYYKSIFLSLGGIGLLSVCFFWLGLALDFTALENAMLGLTTKRVVGYELAVLLGSDPADVAIDKVFRTEVMFSIFQVVCSVFVLVLAFVEGLLSRLKLFALGVGMSGSLLLLLFFGKFLSDDHIISKDEKFELFKLSFFSGSAMVALCWFGLLRTRPSAEASQEDLPIPSVSSQNKSDGDLLGVLKDRDEGAENLEGQNESREVAASVAGEEEAAETPASLPNESPAMDEPAAEIAGSDDLAGEDSPEFPPHPDVPEDAEDEPADETPASTSDESEAETFDETVVPGEKKRLP